MTTEPTDRERLTQAFRKLRKWGWTARANYLCCGTCAHDGLRTEIMAKEKAPRYVFWHRQNDEWAFPPKSNGTIPRDRDLALGHSGEADEILMALRSAGLHAKWDGAPSHCVIVRHRRAKKGA